MKKQIIVLALALLTITVHAQTKSFPTTRVIDKNTVVKDSLGNRYSYEDWHGLTMTGNYRLVPLNPIKDGKPNTDEMEYTIAPFTADQKNAMKKKLGRPRESPYFTTGATIKPFKVRDINGNKIDAKAWAGKTVVLNFWFINCPPCRQEIPELNKIVAKYANNANVIFLGIALDQEDSIKEFIQNSPYNYQLISDGRYYAGLFDIKSYPTNVVIDKEGKVRFHTTGYGLNTVEWIEKTIAESDSQKAL